MVDSSQIVGLFRPAVLKQLLAEGFLHGDCMTVTGKTMAENLESLPGLTEGQEIVFPSATPIKDSGHIQILAGSLAPVSLQRNGAISLPLVVYPRYETCCLCRTIIGGLGRQGHRERGPS